MTPSWRRSRAGRSEPRISFDGFEDITEIGGGAFASVYRAVEISTARPVALKLLNVASMHARLVEDFRAEVRILATVSSHPSIVTLYRTVATPDGRPVLVLELCRGSYAQRVRAAGPLVAAEVVSVGIKVAGALETAHRAGFLHRDMKPQNILVTQFGEPALADFGVATLQASAQATEGVFGFTTLHAPPEVLEGTPLSPATDVYGLASTLYQLLTGRAPFTAFEGEAPASVILRILHDPVAAVTSVDVPAAFSDLLASALAKDPLQRPASAQAMADALRSIEASSGWPLTPYLVWGDEPAPWGQQSAGGGGAGPARSATGPPAVSGPIGSGVGEVQSAASAWTAPGAMGGTGPSVVRPAASERRVLLPDKTGRTEAGGPRVSPAAASRAPGPDAPDPDHVGSRLPPSPSDLDRPEQPSGPVQPRPAGGPADGPGRPTVAEMPLVHPQIGPGWAPHPDPTDDRPEDVDSSRPPLVAPARLAPVVPRAETWAPNAETILDSTIVPTLGANGPGSRSADPSVSPPEKPGPMTTRTWALLAGLVAASLAIVVVVLVVAGVV